MAAETAEETEILAGRLDRAMDEVFSTMLGVGCDAVESGSRPDELSVTALIGLAGIMTGTVMVQAVAAAAMRVAALMTGSEPPDVDATVRDAMGELANMVAGAWKGYDPELASHCLLSPPTVVTGSRYELFSKKATIRIERAYAFNGVQCAVTIACQRG